MYFIKYFSTKNISFHFSFNFYNEKSRRTWIIIVFILLLSLAFIETLYILPIEYDDFDTYYSVPILFNAYHGIVPFYNSLGPISGGIVMPFYTFVITLFSIEQNYGISLFFLVLLLYTIYIFTKEFFSPEVAFWTLLFSLFVPWNIYFIRTQKIDFIFAFFSALAIYALFKWHAGKGSMWLIVSSFFLGFAVNVKLNGLLLVATVMGVLSIFFLLKKISLHNILLYGIITLTMLSPIIIYNIYYYQNPIAPFYLKTNKEIRFEKGMPMTLFRFHAHNEDFIKIMGKEYTDTTRQNMISTHSLTNFAWMLWNTTMNQKGIKYLYIEVGPFLLALLPCMVVFAFYKSQGKIYFFLMEVLVLFFFFWLWKGQQRPWYALSLGYFFFIPCALALINIQNKRIQYMTKVLISIFFLYPLYLSFLYIMNTPNMVQNPWSYLRNQERAYEKFQYPLLRFNERISKEIINNNKDAFILMIPESLVANIDTWDKTILVDRLAWYWGKLLQDAGNMEKAREFLQDQKITHIIFSKKIGESIKSYRFLEKNSKMALYVENMEIYLEKYTDKLFCEDDDFCAYAIK